MSTHLIALDLDGTIEDSRADMVAAVQRLRRAWDLPVQPDAAFRPHVNRGMEHLYRHCFAERLTQVGGDIVADIVADRGADRGADIVADSRTDTGADSSTLAAIRTAYEADYRAHIADTTRLYPGMAAALEALAQLGRLAVVTNKPEQLSRALLDALGIGQLFAAVVGGDTCAESKPSPIPLAAAAALCGLKGAGDSGAAPQSAAAAGAPDAGGDTSAGARVCMIGDSGGDIRCGRAYGAAVIWCAWGYADTPGDIAPDYTAQHPEELPELVRRALHASAAAPAAPVG